MQETSKIVRGRVGPPPLPTPLVSRPRIAGLLARLIEDYPVVYIYATAGAGKTTAVLQAAQTITRPVAWLSASRTDETTGQFLTYLEEALATQVPGVAGVATGAMAAGLPHSVAAGLLAEALGDAPVVLVLDDAERLATAEATLVVLGSFLRYLPPTARTVLVGRSELSIDLGSRAIRLVAGIGEGDLAFTREEAAQALVVAGNSDADPDKAMTATGGWVAGVLFEAWRSADHVPGMGGEADPLHGYLSTQILAPLTPEEVDFLVTTSVLDQVTPAFAEALGLPNPAARLHQLRARHLPAIWSRDGHTLRCHPRFREYLLELLHRRPSAEAREIRHRHAALLAQHDHYEEAVAEFLEVGALPEALVAAEHCLEAVTERADLQLAEQWLAALAAVRDSRRRLAPAELMLAVAGENYREAVELADDLADDGERESLARSSSRAGALMSWSYMHVGELGLARSMLDFTAPGPSRDAMQYCLTLVDDGPPRIPPARALCGDSFDALVMRVHYYRGYFGLTMEHWTTGWAARVGESWRIGALLDMGRTEEAVRLFEATSAVAGEGVWFSAILTVKVMCRLGRVDEARRALQMGRTRIRTSGSIMLKMFSYLEEADLELRGGGDLAAAKTALLHILDLPESKQYLFVREQALTSLALIMLRDGDAATAAMHLRGVVASAVRSDRVFSLAHAGIYLAEAEWRLGNPDAADRAADVALDAAYRQGTNHPIMQALTDYPGVLSRRLDAEANRDSDWHVLGRAWGSSHGGTTAAVGAKIVLTEFGAVALSVNGADVKPRIKKSYELLAYLLDRQASEATRDELLGALFDGRTSDSNLSYLRQAIHHLRQVLPEEARLEVVAGGVRLGSDALITSESLRFEELVAEAAALRGGDRLGTMRRALELVGRGPYLPGVKSVWAEEHRAHLRDRATSLRFEAAETAVGLDELVEAEEFVAQVLREDPFHEAAYRLAMRLADATGDETRVVAVYRACEHALAEIGAAPSAATRDLLTRLHR